MSVIAAVVALGIGAGLGAWLVVRLVVRHLRRSLDTRLGATDAELRRLGDASVWRERGTNDMRRDIAAFRSALEEMRAREGERQAREEQGWATLHRVAAVLSGGQRAGQAGENVLRVLAKAEQVSARLRRTRAPSNKTIRQLDGRPVTP